MKITLLYLVFLIPLLTFSQNQDYAPCVPSSISTEDFLNFGQSNSIMENINTCSQNLLTFHALGTANLNTPDQNFGTNGTDRFVLPICPSEIWGSLQISFGINLSQNETYEICYQLRDKYIITDEDFLGDLYNKQDPNPLLPDMICGIWDLSEEPIIPNNFFCKNIFVKPDGDIGGNTSGNNRKIRVDLSILGSTQNCYSKEININNFLKAPLGAPTDEFQHISGILYSSTMTNNPDEDEYTEKNIHLEENALLIFNDLLPTFYQDIDFFMDHGSKIKVQSGSTLYLINCDFRGCGSIWESIEVENGATLIIDHNTNHNPIRRTSIEDANKGISVSPGGFIEILNSDFYENNVDVEIFSTEEFTTSSGFVNNRFLGSTKGIYISGVLNNLFTFRDNFFEFNNYGVHVEETEDMVNLECPENNKNIFEKCNIGIQTNFGKVRIANTKFIQNEIGIKLFDNHGLSEIENNNIGYNVTGISSTSSPFIANDNSIGVNNGKGADGILITGDQRGTEIFENWIYAKNHGILSMFTKDVNIHDNHDINVESNPALNTSGIYLFFANNNVEFNSITTNMADAGIWLNGNSWIGEASINNNLVRSDSGFDTDGIRMEGTHFANINSNILTGQLKHGISIINSTSNNFECNISKGIEIGMNISVNSAVQTIRGNDFHGQVDLYTESILGVQEHHGNRFFGPDDQDPNDSQVIANFSAGLAEASKFIVDKDALVNSANGYNDYWPTIFNPINLFKNESSQNGTFSECGLIGPGLLIKNEKFFCEMLFEINNSSITEPQGRISFYHALLYYVKNIPVEEWHDCLLEFIEINNLDTEVDIIILQELIKELINNSDNLENDQDEENGWIDGGKSKGTNSSKYFEYQQKLNQDNSDKEEINYKKEVLKELLNISQNGFDLKTVNKEKILKISKLCPSEYGDAVHWSRGLLHIIGFHDKNDFSICKRNPQKNKKSNSTKEHIFKISPNPSSDEVLISSDLTLKSIFISDLNGKIVFKKNTLEKSKILLSLGHLESGIYILTAESNDGFKFSDRVLLTK